MRNVQDLRIPLSLEIHAQVQYLLLEKCLLLIFERNPHFRESYSSPESSDMWSETQKLNKDLFKLGFPNWPISLHILIKLLAVCLIAVVLLLLFSNAIDLAVLAGNGMSQSPTMLPAVYRYNFCYLYHILIFWLIIKTTWD